MPEPDPFDRTRLARAVIDAGLTDADLGPRQFGPAATAVERRDLGLDWPSGLEPVPQALAVEPSPDDPLPKADYVVITWTADEMHTLADVLTPGINPSTRWYRYARKFDDYLPNIRNGAPARMAHRLGSYYPCTIGTRKVLCIKSELHLNQDGIRKPEGTTLPVADFFRQIIAEVQPKLVITTGTAGGVAATDQLGDVWVTRAAKFKVTSEFADAPFAGKTYQSTGTIPRKHLTEAKRLMKLHADRLVEPDFGPPTVAYPNPSTLTPGVVNDPDIKVDGLQLPKFHPILTTDFFEFGTSANHLDDEGCGVEMGDAVLGLVCDELGDAAPRWLVVRNASDPQINGALPTAPVDMQAHWAVFYYQAYGYWTTVNSAIACWAMIAR